MFASFLPVALVFVGLVLVVNGMLNLSGVNAKSVAVMDWVTGGLMVIGAFIGLARGVEMADFQLCCGFFLFGFTYLILGAILTLNLDIRVYGWYALLVAIFAVVFGINCIILGDIGTAYLWLAWALLWGWGFFESCTKASAGPKFTPVFCVVEGIFAAFIPGILMFLGLWNGIWA